MGDIDFTTPENRTPLLLPIWSKLMKKILQDGMQREWKLDGVQQLVRTNLYNYANSECNRQIKVIVVVKNFTSKS